ncbi:MAG: hypothetical protein F6J97_14030 [Leptolyngbya sp. SIO4C1]|nr:hypothetical protein [Leptolyngbya sp. SIO4C1]
MLAYYVIPAVTVFFIVLIAFLLDSTTPKTNRTAWLFVFVAAALWPVTLPFILWKKIFQSTETRIEKPATTKSLEADITLTFR